MGVGDSGNGPSGHRMRLRERFLAGGADAMPDYELLEMTLFAALPRRDTKALAKALRARFGSFADVIAAPSPNARANGTGLLFRQHVRQRAQPFGPILLHPRRRGRNPLRGYYGRSHSMDPSVDRDGSPEAD